MIKWLRCLIWGHDLTYLEDLRVWNGSGGSRPDAIYRLHVCSVCCKTVRKKC